MSRSTKEDTSKARRLFRRAIELNPSFSVESLRLLNRPALVDRLLDGWRKAGWKE